MGYAMNERVDVVVVGLGPVGAVMAQLLAQAGLFVVAVDMSPTIYDKPRAVGIDHESLRILQQLGITDALAPFLGGYRPSEYRSEERRLGKGWVSTCRARWR